MLLYDNIVGIMYILCTYYWKSGDACSITCEKIYTIMFVFLLFQWSHLHWSSTLGRRSLATRTENNRPLSPSTQSQTPKRREKSSETPSWKSLTALYLLQADNVFLAQGTLRPDLIESASSLASSKAHVIKTHHNDTELVRELRRKVRAVNRWKIFLQCIYFSSKIQGMTGRCGLGGVWDHIKAYGFSPIPISNGIVYWKLMCLHVCWGELRIKHGLSLFCPTTFTYSIVHAMVGLGNIVLSSNCKFDKATKSHFPQGNLTEPLYL